MSGNVVPICSSSFTTRSARAESRRRKPPSRQPQDGAIAPVSVRCGSNHLKRALRPGPENTRLKRCSSDPATVAAM